MHDPSRHADEYAYLDSVGMEQLPVEPWHTERHRTVHAHAVRMLADMSRAAGLIDPEYEVRIKPHRNLGRDWSDVSVTNTHPALECGDHWSGPIAPDADLNEALMPVVSSSVRAMLHVWPHNCQCETLFWDMDEDVLLIHPFFAYFIDFMWPAGTSLRDIESETKHDWDGAYSSGDVFKTPYLEMTTVYPGTYDVDKTPLLALESSLQETVVYIPGYRLKVPMEDLAGMTVGDGLELPPSDDARIRALAEECRISTVGRPAPGGRTDAVEDAVRVVLERVRWVLHSGRPQIHAPHERFPLIA